MLSVNETPPFAAASGKPVFLIQPLERVILAAL